MLFLLPAPLGAEQVLPTSHLEIAYHDIIPEPPTWRVRYVAPGLDGGVADFAEVAGDMELLCTQDALPRVIGSGGDPERIVLTLMSSPVEFGVMTPDATQFFESYTVQNGLCIWEAF